jgi:hypothetical protein
MLLAARLALLQPLQYFQQVRQSGRRCRLAEILLVRSHVAHALNPVRRAGHEGRKDAPFFKVGNDRRKISPRVGSQDMISEVTKIELNETGHLDRR